MEKKYEAKPTTQVGKGCCPVVMARGVASLASSGLEHGQVRLGGAPAG